MGSSMTQESAALSTLASATGESFLAPTSEWRSLFSRLPGHDELHHQPLLAATTQGVLAVNQLATLVLERRDGLRSPRLLGVGIERQAVEDDLLAVERLAA